MHKLISDTVMEINWQRHKTEVNAKLFIYLLTYISCVAHMYSLEL